MTAETATIQVPQPLYHRLERLAQLTNRSLESLVAQTLTATLPPLPDDLPTEQREALLALETLSNEALVAVAGEIFTEEEYERFLLLGDNRATGTLTPEEQRELDEAWS